MQSDEIRKRFLRFFEERGHVVVSSSSLVPDDPSVLLTTAGMQQFKKYYTGELDAKNDFVLPLGKPALGTVSIQKCFRTSDIDEVGDERHLTFFEMLGNFSFWGYFKKEAITWAHEFITKELGLDISYVTVFEGSPSLRSGSSAPSVPRDEESKEIWKSLDSDLDVREEGMDDVFWGPTGASGPCGPTTEIYCKNGAGEDVEVWNIVFNEFLCTGSRDDLITGKAELKPLPFKGIDTGMGLERLTMCVQKTKTVFETDLFVNIERDQYNNFFIPNYVGERVKRIVLDHARAIVFLICDGVTPSNKGAGYILRRLIRRIVVHQYLAGDPSFDVNSVLSMTISEYKRFYGELDIVRLLRIFHEEDSRFLLTVQDGLKELRRMQSIDAQSAFFLFATFGLPYEIIKELGGERALSLNRGNFDEEFEKHKEISKTGAEKKFGGHGLVLDTGELKAGDEEGLAKATRLHTATHLLQQALRDALGSSVKQMGSDVTVERTRFDFSFDRKMTPEEIKKVEEIMNAKIQEDLPVSYKEMSKEEAEKSGALHFFKEKYPDMVKVYYIGENLESAYSKEFCGGPHVKRTGEIGRVKVLKEEAVGAGVRRVRVGLDVLYYL